jgi:hypothetical protein
MISLTPLADLKGIMNRPGSVEHECHDPRCVDGSPLPWVRASMTSVFPWL